MRLGMIAALIFIVLSFGVLFSVVTNESLINTEVEKAMKTMQSATKVIQEGELGPDQFLTLLAAPFLYFDSLITIAWAAFNNPVYTGDIGSPGWTIVPYFTVSPFMMVLFLGFIILLIGVIQKQV